MPSTPGCIENHQKLMSVLEEAKKKHKSLAVCWLDLQNAYRSVHHSLIEYSLSHYHAPSRFCDIVKAFYSQLSASQLNGPHLEYLCKLVSTKGILCLLLSSTRSLTPWLTH